MNKYSLGDLQKSALKSAKLKIQNKNGYLHSLISELGFEISNAKISKEVNPRQIGKIFFLAEYVNNEIDAMYDRFCAPGKELTKLSTEWMMSQKFRDVWKELKKERDDTYGMLYDWIEKSNKQKIEKAFNEYGRYLLRLVINK